MSELTAHLYRVCIAGPVADQDDCCLYGIAATMPEAMRLVFDKAVGDGWPDVHFKQVTDVGEIAFDGGASKGDAP